MEKLQKELIDFQKRHKVIHDSNTKEEETLRKEYKRCANIYKSNMQSYDDDLKNITREKQKAQDEYDDTSKELKDMKETFELLLEEQRKRDAIREIMERKKREQDAKMNKLINATEYV